MFSFFKPPRFTIRRAADGEARMIRQLHIAHLWSVEMAGYDATDISAFLDLVPTAELRSFAGCGVFVAEANGDMAGAAAWTPLDSLATPDRLVDGTGQPVRLIDDEAVAVIRMLFVGPRWSFTELAAPLLSAAEADAAAAGRNHADAFVTFGPATVYRSLGYRPIGQLAIGLGNGSSLLPILRLRKPLNGVKVAA